MCSRAAGLVFGALFAVFVAGCGGDDVPEDAPVTPAPESAEYQQYNSAEQGGPTAAHGGGHAGP
jgi:hypothetical protein